MSSTSPSTLAPDRTTTLRVSRRQARRDSFVQRRGSPRPRRYASAWAITLFLLPGLAVYSVLVLYPAVISIYYSLLNWDGGPVSRAQFIGLGNFRALFSDPYLPLALKDTARLVGISWVVQLPLALLLAFAITRLKRGGSIYRFFFIIPYIIPAATLALVWSFVFSGESYGILNSVLSKLGLSQLIRPWLSADGIVQWVTSFPQALAYVGFFMVIFIAALVAIPAEYYEAARIDGAGAWRQLFYVTIPSIRNIYVFSLIVSLQLALSAYIYPYLMTGGGPLHISETPVSYSLYLLYSQQEWGYASAVNVLMFIIGALVVTAVWRIRRRANA